MPKKNLFRISLSRFSVGVYFHFVLPLALFHLLVRLDLLFANDGAYFCHWNVALCDSSLTANTKYAILLPVISHFVCAFFFSPPFFLNVVHICLYVIVLCCLTPRFSAILTSRCCVVFCDIRHQEPTNARDRERFFCCCITVYCILHPSFYHIAVFRLLRFLGRHLSSFLELFVLRLAAFSNRLQLFLGHFNILKTLFYVHLHS